MPEIIFEPLQGVGPFRFGEMIESLVDKIGLIGGNLEKSSFSAQFVSSR